MKKQFALLCSIAVLSVGVITFSSCKKKANDNFSGTYTGVLSDSLVNANGSSGSDTVVVTVSGSTITIKDNSTGSSYSGTLGSTTSGTYLGYTTTTASITFTNVAIAQAKGGATVNYSGSGTVDYYSVSGATAGDLSVSLTDAASTPYSLIVSK